MSRSLWRKYLALTRRGLGVLLEYRVAMLIWMLSAAFPLVMLAVWLSLAQNGPIGGYAEGDFVAYYLLAFYMRQMTAVWVAWELDYDIRHGDLNIKLVHPLNPIHEYIAFNLADKLMRFVLFTPLVLLVAWAVPQTRLGWTIENLVIFAFALVGAWLMRFLTQYALGLFAFWTSQALVLQDVFWMLFLLLGGGVAPLDLLPDPLRTMAMYLPFRFMLSFPIEVMMEQISWTEKVSGLGVIAIWSGILYLAYRLLWWRGLRRFGAFGA